MANEIELDPFMICLEVLDYCPDTNVSFWLNYFENKIQGKIHIISFRTIRQEIKERYSSEKFLWVSGIAQSYDAIGRYIEKQHKKDVVIIAGGERLTYFSSQRAISSLELDGKTSDLHLREDENWVEFSKNIDELYGKYQTSIDGLILICNVNDTIANAISKEVQNSKNLSICRTEIIKEDAENKEEVFFVLRAIKNKSLQEALEIISQNARKISQDEVIMCQAVAYHSNGNITKSIELLNEIYLVLSNEQKIFLAKMHIMQKNKEDAQKIFEEIYSDDNQQRGLYEIGLDAYGEETQRYIDILLEGIKYHPYNMVLIEKYANWLTENGKHKEAAVWFRKINKPYYELVARVNDLLAEEQTDIKIVKAYLFDIVENNPELRNEAILRVALYAKKYGHYYNAYNMLREADLNEINDNTQSILKEKISILSDTEKASKALGKLKPYRKEKDREILLSKRCSLLLECINYFSYIENGHSYWRNLLECQQIDTWNVSLRNYLINFIRELRKNNFSNMLSESYISMLDISEEKSNCDTAIFCLRKSNCGEMTVEKYGLTREEIVKGSWNLIEVNGTNIQRIWLRYYCSIGASILNENPQDANNFSLGILEYGKIAENSERNLITALFLMSWANSQYRLGNSFEGIACAIIAIKQLLLLNEVTPVLEEGLNIISKYLAMYEKNFSEVERKDIAESIKGLEIYNESLRPVLYHYVDDPTGIIQDYEKKVRNNDKDINWLIDLNNLIGSRVKNKDYDIAVNYIKDNYSLAKVLIEQRKDMAPKMLYSWGDILIKFGGSIENVTLGLGMLDSAIMLMQKRRQVYHQEERAALAEEYDLIIREFLCFSGLYYSADNIEKEIKKKLKEGICKKMAICLPLSIIEQKNYNIKKVISIESDENHKKLQHLKQEYAIMIKSNGVENDDVSELAKQIENLTYNLVHHHPYYMPLKKCEGIKWDEIQKVLKSNEVVYQYVLTDMVVVSILVTDKWIDVKSKLFNNKYDNPLSGMKKYGEIVENSNVGDDELEYYSAVISEVIAEHMCEYVFNYDIKSVYIVPDISKSIFPFSAVQYKGKYLIDQVDEIINFIDYEQLINSLNTTTDDVKIVNKVFGKKEERSIHYINKWLEQHPKENVANIIDCSDDLKMLMEECKNGANTVVIYGHGEKIQHQRILKVRR